MLQSMGSQRVGHDLVAEQQQQQPGGKKPASQRQVYLPLKPDAQFMGNQFPNLQVDC